jgi:hypothetical protein
MDQLKLRLTTRTAVKFICEDAKVSPELKKFEVKRPKLGGRSRTDRETFEYLQKIQL